MTYDAGRAAARYDLDTSGFAAGAQRVIGLYAQIRTAAQQTGAAQPRLTPGAGGAGGGRGAGTPNGDVAARQQQRLADSAIRAATAQRDYQRALTLVGSELAKAGQGTERYNNLLARQASISRQAAKESRPSGGLNGLLAQGAGALGIGIGLQQTVQFAEQAGELSRVTTRAQNSLQALAGSASLYGESLAAAREQQRLFGGSLADNIDGITGLVTVSRSSGVELSKLIDLSQRLSIKDPSQGIGGARIALNEALSGDPTSLARRYEIPRSALRALRDESTTSAEKLQILDTYLNNIGITSGVVAGAIPKDTIALNELNQQSERAVLALGEIVSRLQAAGAVALTTGITIGDQRITIGAFADGVELAAAANRAFNDALARGQSVANATLAAQTVLAQGNVNYGKTTQEATQATQDYADAAEREANRLDDARQQQAAATSELVKGIQAKQAAAIADQQSRELQEQLADAAFRVATGQSTQAAEVARLTALYPGMADAATGLIGQQLRLAEATDEVAAALGRQRIEAQRTAKGATDASGAIGFDSPGRRGTGDVDAVVAQIEANQRAAEAEKVAAAEAERNLRFQRASATQRIAILRSELADLKRKGAAQSEVLNKQAELEAAEQQLEKRSSTSSSTRVRQTATAQDQIENRLEDSYRKQLQLQEDYQLRAQRSEQDFATRQSRSREDYERQRRRLLAEGKIFEAEQLRQEFERTQRRETEDFQRQQARSDQDEQLRRSRERDDAGIDTSRIQDRAAIRGVRVPGGRTGAVSRGAVTAPTGGAPTGAAADNPAIANQLRVQVQFAPIQLTIDGRVVAEAIYADIDGLFGRDVESVSLSAAPRSAPSPLAGPRP